MQKETVDIIKKTIKSIAKHAQKSAEQIGLDFEMEPIVYSDFLEYFLYLTASDGNLSWSELNYISDVLEIELTPKMAKDYILEHNIYPPCRKTPCFSYGDIRHRCIIF